MSHPVGPTVLPKDGGPALKAPRTDYSSPSRPVWGSWQSPRGAPPGPRTAANTGDQRFDRWISIPPPQASDGLINSIQNGILLRRDIHTLFDRYQFSVNPDVRPPPLQNHFIPPANVLVRMATKFCVSSRLHLHLGLPEDTLILLSSSTQAGPSITSGVGILDRPFCPI